MAEGAAKVVIVGAGAAGTAAAWAAARARAEVVVIHDRAGATALYSGALDLAPWERADGAGLEAELMAFAAALGAWKLAPGRHRVATLSGVVRPARGLDGALLDLEPLAGRTIAVADVDRADWDARLMARALGGSPWAERTRTRFVVVPLELLRQEHERTLGSYDFARLFDDPDRALELASGLRRAAGSYDAWLLGPWLGIESELADRLRDELGMPVGESTSPPGGAAGARFDHARDRLFDQLGVSLRSARASVLEPIAGGWRVGLAPAWAEPGTLAEESIEATAVVLALGGVAAGGVRVDPAKPSHPGGACFHASIEAKLELLLDGMPVDRVSTLHGVDFPSLGLEALERVGIAAIGPRARGLEQVLVAGDCVADRPRTVLEAARTGIAAGRAATRAP
jgi:anaerobic glycerol-3-phosphate dehydrogenase